MSIRWSGKRSPAVIAFLIASALGFWGLAGYVLVGATVRSATGTTSWPAATAVALLLIALGVGALVFAIAGARRGPG